MRVRGILVVGVVMAVVLLLGTGFSGTVYAKEHSAVKEEEILKVSRPILTKNLPDEKVLSFKVGLYKYILHYKRFNIRKYTVWITGVSETGKRYTTTYSINKGKRSWTAYINNHKAYVLANEIIKKSLFEYGRVGITHTIKDGWIHWVDDGNPNGGPIKYGHPDRDYYHFGTWENEILSGKKLFHGQIGTDDIGWIVDLPPELAGAAVGTILGALIGSVIPGIGNLVGAVIGAIIGVVIGFISGNVLKKWIYDEGGAAWAWISHSSIFNIINAHNAPWWAPWEHFAHIDYFKIGTLEPYSVTIYVQ